MTNRLLAKEYNKISFNKVLITSHTYYLLLITYYLTSARSLMTNNQ